MIIRAALFALLAFPGLAVAQCVALEDPEDLFARADVVFTGTVLSNQLTGKEGFHLSDVAIGTLRLEQSWKGSPSKEIRVGSDAPFVVGKVYLVFAGGNPLSTSINCHWAEPKETASQKVRYLERVAMFRPLYGGVLSTAQGEALRQVLPYDSISIERTGGMVMPGDHFKLTLLRSGEATLSTSGTIAGKPGEFVGSVDIFQLGKINQLIDEAGFNNLLRRYASPLTDMQTVTVTVAKGSTTNTVVDYGGAGPVKLWSIQQALMAIAREIAWKPR